jgi:hypothetical protein
MLLLAEHTWPKTNRGQKPERWAESALKGLTHSRKPHIGRHSDVQQVVAGKFGFVGDECELGPPP